MQKLIVVASLFVLACGSSQGDTTVDETAPTTGGAGGSVMDAGAGGGAAGKDGATGGAGKGAGGNTGTGGATGTGGTTQTGGNTGTGGAGTGGAAGTGASTADSGPPHVVGKCDGLGAVGAWENITPSGIDLSGFGLSHINTVPSNPSILYMSGDKSGIYKSTDCGASWVHIDTGTLGSEIDKGTAAVTIDSDDPNVLYTGSLYGLNGFFKSTDGGVNWVETLTGDVKLHAPYGGFIGGVSMDPGDHLHLIVAWHQVCDAPYASSCYAETKDGAATWTMRNGDPSWFGGEGSAIQFLTSDSWLFSSSSNGMWRSTDHGATWTKVEGAQISHGAGQLYRAPNGSYFLGSATGVLYSPDGVSWSTVANSGTLIAGVIGDGSTVWTGTAFPYNPPQRPTTPFLPFHTAKVSAPTAWTTFPSPKLTSGGTVLAYDPDHNVLYSANYWEGLYRVVVK